MSRFTFVKTVQFLPGSCMLCGKGTDAVGFVDTGHTIDGYGQCAICYRCVQGLNAAFNLDAMARPLITEAALSAVGSLSQAVQELKEQHDTSVDRLADYVHGLDNHFARCAEVLNKEFDLRVRQGRIPTDQTDRDSERDNESIAGSNEEREDGTTQPPRKHKLGSSVASNFDVLDA